MPFRRIATPFRVITTALFLLLTVPANADDDAPFTPKVKPAMHVTPVAGAITIDGVLDETTWQQAAYATGFTEIMPEQDVAPLVETEVYVAYDATHLYVAFRAYDDPSAIRATLRDRDDLFEEDFVALVLDTYGDASQAYELFVNPLGVQADALNAGGQEDVGFDLVFTSAGRVTETGYEVELAVPFSSLRFPRAEQHAWNVTFFRNYPRESRHLYSWAAVDVNSPCMLCQMGTMEGIADVEAGSRLELLPALVGSQAASLADASAPAAGLDGDRLQVQPSLNLRYTLSSSLTAEATLNPDFSQVESDAAQIDVNSTFALSLPERRPFFQEGSELFDTPIDVVYTRSINDPIGATKVTGRSGRTSVALLSALDENTPLLLPFTEQSATVQAGRSVSNIVRVRQGFGESSFAGATLTDRRLLDGGAGTLLSADARLQFRSHYSLRAQVAVSRTEEPTREALSANVGDATFHGGRYTAALDGEQFHGQGATVSLQRSARHWIFDLTYEGYAPTFRADNGFIRKNDFHSIKTYHGYKMYPSWRAVDQVFPLMVVGRTYDYDGRVRRTVVQPQLSMQLIGQTHVGATYVYAHERFRGAQFDGFGYGVVQVNSRFSELLSGGGHVKIGRDIARFLEAPALGRTVNGSLRLTVKPTQRLTLQPSVSYAALYDRATDEPYFTGYIFRMQTSYQFSRELSLRLITQYNDFSDQMSVEPLLAYKLNPFSVFYVGSAHRYDQFDAVDTPYGFMPSERQLFFKFQYLLQR